MKHHLANYTRLQDCFSSVKSTTDIRARSTLYKIYNNVSNIYLELDKEAVECRRTKRVTPKYTEIEARFDQAVHEFEQWVLIAVLSY